MLSALRGNGGDVDVGCEVSLRAGRMRGSQLLSLLAASCGFLRVRMSVIRV